MFVCLFFVCEYLRYFWEKTGDTSLVYPVQMFFSTNFTSPNYNYFVKKRSTLNISFFYFYYTIVLKFHQPGIDHLLFIIVATHSSVPCTNATSCTVIGQTTWPIRHWTREVLCTRTRFGFTQRYLPTLWMSFGETFEQKE